MDFKRDQITKKHINSLGFDSIVDYQSWCLENGFSQAIHKSPMQRRKEVEFFRENKYATSLKQGSKKVTFDLPVKPTDDLIAFVSHLQKKSKLLQKHTKVFRKPYMYGVLALYMNRGEWVRDYSEWKPKSKNIRKQFHELAQYLIAEYDVPIFMDEAWFSHKENKRSLTASLYDKEGWPQYDSTKVNWYIGMAKGKNIRKLGIPLELSKKQAHWFSFAPADYTIGEALRYGQILGAKGEIRLVTEVNRVIPVETHDENNFWWPLINIFINNPMLDPNMFGQVVDYVNSQRLGPDAPNPNFSFKGRNADSLLKQTEDWHVFVNKTRGKSYREWEASGIRSFSMVEGKEGEKSYRYWDITELCNSKELAQEGRTLKHCVRSYTASCMAGRSSIFSLKCNGERKVTIEVQGERVAQIRGLANRHPTEPEKRIIDSWKRYNNLW